MKLLLTNVEKSEPAFCVDGRPDKKGETGPKMLGGSLHIVLLWCLWHCRPFNEKACEHVFELLKNAGYGIGVHRGSQKNKKENISDCGFADNLPAILEVAMVETDDIRRLISDLFDHHVKDKLSLTHTYAEDLALVWEKISTYDRGDIMIWGEDCIQAAERSGAVVNEVVGEHQEKKAVINLKPETTLDSIKVNNSGHQAFNLDLWIIMEESKIVSIPNDFAVLTSLILYVATEKILVERKGKQPLPVEIHP